MLAVNSPTFSCSFFFLILQHHMISIMSSVQKPGDYLDYHFLIIHDIHEPRISTSKGVDLDGERQFSWQLEKTPVTCQELGEISIR